MQQCIEPSYTNRSNECKFLPKNSVFEDKFIDNQTCSLLVVFIHAWEIPVLIPNTEVKPSVVDDTWTV